jgi:uncharacterized protein HemX
MSKRDDAERDAPAAGPGAATKTALRAIDACLHFLQELRNRFAPSDETGARGDRRGQPDAKHAPAAAEEAPAPRSSFLKLALVALIGLLVGGGAGALYSYRTLSHQIREHASVVDRMQEELDSTRKEDARNVKLLDKFQRENAEYRHEAREAQRVAESAQGQVADLEAQIETMKFEHAKRDAEKAEEVRRAAGLAKQRATQRVPQKTGNCAVGTAAEMAECIEKFNR